MLFKKTIKLSEYVRVYFNTSLTEPTDGISGMTFNAKRGTVILIRNLSAGSAQMYEYTLAGRHVRTITQSNFQDTEAICWMYDDWYAVAEENPQNRICIVRIPDNSLTCNRIATENVSWATGLAYANLGVEGVSYDKVRNVLYFMTEKSSAGNNTTGTWPIYEMNIETGTKRAMFDLITVVGSAGLVTDVSDMDYDSIEQCFYLLGEELDRVFKVSREGKLLDIISLSGINQPEGLAFSPRRDFMFVCGEVKQLAVYKLKTQGRQKNIMSSKLGGIRQGVLPK